MEKRGPALAGAGGDVGGFFADTILHPKGLGTLQERTHLTMPLKTRAYPNFRDL